MGQVVNHGFCGTHDDKRMVFDPDVCAPQPNKNPHRTMSLPASTPRPKRHHDSPLDQLCREYDGLDIKSLSPSVRSNPTPSTRCGGNFRRSNSTSSLYITDAIEHPTRDILPRTANKVALVMQVQLQYEQLHGFTEPLYHAFELNHRQMTELMRQGAMDNLSIFHKDHELPTVDQIHAFLLNISEKTILELGCVVVAAVYLDRLIARRHLVLTSTNWRNVLMACILMASKVFDDRSMINIDYAQLFSRMYTIQQINAIEREVLTLLDFDVHVSPQEYAMAYFQLREFDQNSPVVERAVRKCSGIQTYNFSATLESTAPELSPLGLRRHHSCGEEAAPKPGDFSFTVIS